LRFVDGCSFSADFEVIERLSVLREVAPKSGFVFVFLVRDVDRCGLVVDDAEAVFRDLAFFGLL
jgi:hypothetical protein